MTFEEWNYNAAATPGNTHFKDGLEEIGFYDHPGEVEDIFGDILNVATAPLKMVGQAVGGILGGGGGGGSGPLGLPNPGQLLGNLPIVGGLFGGQQQPAPGTTPVQQGVGQALGMGPAQSPLGSLVGAGLGGAAPGTGPLPGVLGQMVQQLFGTLGLPPAAQGATAGAMYDQLANHTEKAGRAVVRRILGATNPQLAQLQRLVELRRNQIQATAEHNQLNTANAFQGQVLGQLAALQNRVGAGGTWRRY